jgi:hypothetical protein
MVMEEVFGIEIADVSAEEKVRGLREIVDCFEVHLSNKRLNEPAAALLNRLR